MTTNGEISSADAEMAECDGEEVVTMMDVLKEQQEFEDDANAVLGGSDEKECTYSQGYIKRQAIYACMTCCPESKDDPTKRAGFCLACSLSCHENHDLVELYTKRNFRCDCGNPKFKSPCQFTPNKPELNTENVYNQNFIGLYCSCSKPYGDQESTLDDEMIQCIICEDWWHATHLDAVVPAQDQYSEMICKLCMAKNDFLHDYSDLTVNIEMGDVDVVKVNGVDNMETDKLTNGSATEEKEVNGTDEKLTNGIEESSVEIETGATEATNDEVTAENEGNTEKENPNTETDEAAIEKEGNTEKENPNIEQLENETVTPNESKETSDVPMDTDETDKATEVLPAINSEDKPEVTTADKADDSDAPEQLVTSTTSDKAEEKNDLDERTEENETLDDKTEESSSAVNNVEVSSSGDKAMDAEVTAGNAESDPIEKEASEAPKEKDEGSAPAVLETVTENITEATEESPENMDTTENNTTEELEKKTNAEKVDDHESLETSPSVETNKSNSANNETDITTDEAKAQDEEIKEDNKDIENEIEAKESCENETSKLDVATNETTESKSTNEIESDSNDIVPELVSTENKRKIDDVDNISAKKPKLDDSKCLRPKGVRKVHKGATFWPSTFRQKLCTCNECIEMYKDLSVLFLTDQDDTVFAYETLGKERTAGKLNQYEKGMEALCSLGRTQQIDALTEYNKMRDKLLTFLQSFKDKKEIVTENDIKSFFAGMKPEKRTDGVYFCR